MRNVLMNGNKATVRGRDGNAIYMQGGDLMVENCTMVAHINDVPNGAAISRAAGAVTVRNTVLWDNNTDFYDFAGTSCDHSLSTQLTHGVDGNITTSPCFEDAPAADFRLAAGSPAIDAGLNADWMKGAIDLEGNTRRQGNTVDMGAFESKHIPTGTIFAIR